MDKDLRVVYGFMFRGPKDPYRVKCIKDYKEWNKHSISFTVQLWYGLDIKICLDNTKA